ncbi:pentapeptide repeat-containing protein [Nocardia tengchongensis]|uniref:pentapeptide repeat-containing protein n=1 Tax=Nocardia tengchongensis TaxID=2055889 RepID=UPI003695CA0B
MTNALLVIGSGGAGFGAAALSGVKADFSQPLATALAGAGALSAGVLAYINGQRSRAQDQHHHQLDMSRERERHQEDAHRAKESDLRDRYTAIAAQIAHESAAVRQAGVYALTALADDWHALGEDDERQVCINLLQWYLRVPMPAGQAEEPNLPEHEIRQTIVGILTERGRRNPENTKSWAYTAISLRQASLPHCTFQRVNLTRLDLNSANLTNANLTGTDLTGTDLTGANLTGANLTNANLNSANLDGANLTNANLNSANLTNANLYYADLTNANLYYANLTDANLDRADLTSANLHNATLYNANLSRVDLTETNLTNANLIGANLNGVRHIENVRWPNGFIPPSQ